MNNKFWKSSLIFIAIAMFSSTSILFVFAHPHAGQIEINGHTHEPQTEIISIDGIIGIEKSILLFHAPTDNSLPWGFVEGKIANHVSDYPVIIQFYNEEGYASHFAQTNVNDDGSYEYKFRVQSVDDGSIINAFEGDYSVFIFKVVYLHPNENQI